MAIQPIKVAIDDKASGTQLIRKLPPMAATASRAASPRGTRSCERAEDGDDQQRLRPHSLDRAMARHLHEMIVSRTASTTTRSIQRRSSSPGSSPVRGPIAVRAHEDGHARAEEEARSPTQSGSRSTEWLVVQENRPFFLRTTSRY